MNKGKKSILNAVAALMQMVVTSLVGLVFYRTILNTSGSDFNGINSTVSQIVGALMVLEGGFSLASNVALFEPFWKKDYEKVNGILTATRNRFLAVGGVAFVLGLILTGIYPFAVSSAMPKWMIAALMLTALVPACYNLAFNMKYRVLLLTDQKEFIISFFTAITYVFGNGIAILLLRSGFSLVVARCSIMFLMLANYWIIGLFCRRRYAFARYNVMPDYKAIKGTKSVIVLKLTSIMYTSVPIIAISTIPENGALLASVYAVYKSIVAIVRDSLTSITNAPRLAFGALFSEGRDEEAKRFFIQYEMLTCIGISTILGTTCLLLMPFVGLYTKGIRDIRYQDTFLAVIMLATVFLEILHIPSGQIIQMKGNFAVARRIQTIAFILLVPSLIIGRMFWGLYGVAIAVLIASLSLAMMEIGYISKRVYNRSILNLLRNMLPCLVICLFASYIGLNNMIKIHDYLSFILFGIVSVMCFGTLSLGVYYLLDKQSVNALFLMLKNVTSRKKQG